MKMEKNKMPPSTSEAPPIEGGGAEKQESQPVSTSSERKSSQEPSEPLPELLFLFEKKIDDAADLKQLAIEFCSGSLKMALGKKTLDNIKVYTTDPSGTYYTLSFAQLGGREGRYTIRPWENIVAGNRVEEEDFVTGIGAIIHDGHISLQLNLLKKNAALGHPITPSEDWFAEAFLLFEKKLENEDVHQVLNSKLVIRSCKDVVKQAIDQWLNDEVLMAFLSVTALDPIGETYTLKLSRNVSTTQDGGCTVHDGWEHVVSNNGLGIGDRVWCGRKFLPDGSIDMKIDVDRHLE